MEKIPFEKRFENEMVLEAEYLNNMVDEIEKKQSILVSGTNIKTINGQSLVGEGNLTIIGDGNGGNISAMTIQNTDSLLSTGDITFEGFDIQRTAFIPDYPEGGEITFTDLGYILVSDGTLTGTTGTWVHSSFLEIDRVENVGVFVGHGTVAAAAYYSEKDFGSYIKGYKADEMGGTSVTGETIQTKAPEGAKYVVFSTNGASQQLKVILSAAESTSSIKYIIKPLEDESEDGNESTVSSVKLAVSDKMIHFSFDDTIASLRDLTENSSNYSSVFNQPFFKVLKELHDSYGACFSCYCFYQILNSDDTSVVDFSLEDVTDAYAEEFTANADWLKFGYHSLNGSMNYGSATDSEVVKTAYNNFITQIVRITGSVKCIDLVVRLQNFAGSKIACQAMRDCACGIIGFLAGDYAEAGKTLPVSFADYTVSGYYLTSPAKTFLAHHGRYFDAEEQLYFYPSCLRLDNITSANVPTYMNYFNTIDMYGRSSTLIMYCHENQMFKNGSCNVDYKKRMAAVCDWGMTNGYIFGFPMNKIRQAY